MKGESYILMIEAQSTLESVHNLSTVNSPKGSNLKTVGQNRGIGRI